MSRIFLRWLTTIVIFLLSLPCHAQNNAAFVSQTVPASMTAGSTYDVSVTMMNTGTSTWSETAGFRLGAQNPQDNYTWGHRILLTATVAPGTAHTFTFKVTAPSATGTFNFQWKMVQEFVQWFGALAPNVAIQVVAPTALNGADFVSQSVPTVMVAGQSYNVAVTMRNSGGTTWTVGAAYKLGAQNPQDNYVWRNTNRVELGGNVLPGQSTTFNFTVTAPSAAGTYDFQWKMVREFVAWFGNTSTNLKINVNPQATNSTITYFHSDAAGSPMVATNSNGNVVWKENYRPYGERVTNQAVASVNNSLWFAGKPYDENSGLSYMGARYYDPSLGRFMGPDPADVDISNFHSFNRYAYANNNPYRFVDPDGHSPLDVAFLVYDLGALGVSMYTGVGVGAALTDVALSAIGVASPVPFVGQALKAARAAHRGAEIIRGTEKAAEVAHGTEQLSKSTAKLHGNDLRTTKPAQGYSLRDRRSDEVVKYGDTTMGTKRYSKPELKRMEAYMQFEAKGTKREMHDWQHEQILQYKEEHDGLRPFHNKTDW